MLFQKRFRRPPSQLRKARSKSDGRDGIELKLSFRPPYDWEAIIRFYQSHPILGIERVTPDRFERVFRISDTIGFLQVQAIPGEANLKLKVVTENPGILFEVVSRIRRMFDLDCDPIVIANSFAQNSLLSTLYDRFPGLRVAGGWDLFETAVCSILGQLVSAEQRCHLVGQLVRGYGEEIAHPVSGEKAYLFPGPAILAESDLGKIKTTLARKETIRGFSRRVLSGAISLSEAQDPLSFRQALLETKGIGPWSAEYISLRAIGDTDAFPRTDLILKRVLELHPDLDLDAIKPWRAYAAIYLWKGFAEILSRKKRRNDHDAVLQGNKISRWETQAVGKRPSAGRRSLGDRKSRPSKGRRPRARSAPPDPT
ncbi:MAG TPA: AlkA N-terminal domain-containing protein [Candidatus Binatia bacterium]|nr:AlkA N-terminal domain-containing protein [Candidatus Binatia bacterium]